MDFTSDQFQDHSILTNSSQELEEAYASLPPTAGVRSNRILCKGLCGGTPLTHDMKVSTRVCKCGCNFRIRVENCSKLAKRTNLVITGTSDYKKHHRGDSKYTATSSARKIKLPLEQIISVAPPVVPIAQYNSHSYDTSNNTKENSISSILNENSKSPVIKPFPLPDSPDPALESLEIPIQEIGKSDRPISRTMCEVKKTNRSASTSGNDVKKTNEVINKSQEIEEDTSSQPEISKNRRPVRSNTARNFYTNDDSVQVLTSKPRTSIMGSTINSSSSRSRGTKRNYSDINAESNSISNQSYRDIYNENADSEQRKSTQNELSRQDPVLLLLKQMHNNFGQMVEQLKMINKRLDSIDKRTL